MLHANIARQAMKQNLTASIENYLENLITSAIDEHSSYIRFSFNTQHPDYIKHNESLVIKMFEDNGYDVDKTEDYGNTYIISW